MIEVAKYAALEAGKILLSMQGKKLTANRKGTKDNFATEADIKSEKRILQLLKSKFPKHDFLSEEYGKIDNKSDYCWVIDPLDGTTNYFLGLPTYGVSIGLLENGIPYLGVINIPQSKSLYWTIKGSGAFKNGQKIFVNSETDLSKLMIGFELAWIGERAKEAKKIILPLIDKTRYSPILGCTVAGLSYVAEGIFGGYIHQAFPWDFVAGAAIIEEAGGLVTDYKGKPVNWLSGSMSVLASNGKIHNKILSLLRP